MLFGSAKLCNMSSEFIASRFVLAVRNLRISTDFYMNVLGFKRDFGDESDGWSFLSRNSVRLMLGECVDEVPASELNNHSYFAYINVTSVDDLFNEIVASTENKKLIIESNNKFKVQRPIEIRLTIPKVDYIDITGNGTVEYNPTKYQKKFSVEL